MGKRKSGSKSKEPADPQIEQQEDNDETAEQRPKRSDIEYDPDGTHHVHRGLTQKEARQQRHQLLLQLATKEQKRNKRNKEQHASIYDDDALDSATKKQKPSALAKDKILAARLETQATKQVQARIAALDAAEILHTGNAGLLEAEHDMERTTALSQVALKRTLLEDSSSADTARHIYDLTIESPHGMTYDRSGRYAILYSKPQNRQGHVALLDCHTRSLLPNGGEWYVHHALRDATFLHNHQLMAVAPANQPVTIYDHMGTEIHRLSEHLDPVALQFLPYHFLLASVGRSGYLKYTDTSTGELVSSHKTRGAGGPGGDVRAGDPVVLRQNPHNAVLHLGHSNGTVTLWSPASSKYLVKFLCHKGASVLSMAVDLAGRTMVTGGADRQVKVWDLRMTYRNVHSYYTAAGPPTSLDISQRGILGIGHAGHATFWPASALKVKEKDPYMHHAIPRGGGPVESLRFRPYEDVCGIGHSRGVSSIVIPGSGEPNLDTAEYHTNPFQDTKQRREAEVKALLDKLSPEMITLNPEIIGGMEESDPHTRLERIRDQQELANSKAGVVKKQVNKKRGRSKIQSKLGRKQKNVVDQNMMKLREAREKEKAEAAAERNPQNLTPAEATPKVQAPTALKRFFS